MVVKEIPALHFKPVDDNFAKKQINSINVKKATCIALSKSFETVGKTLTGL
jgi:hypothetical protein